MVLTRAVVAGTITGATATATLPYLQKNNVESEKGSFA
jgi:hypothetical protein